MSATTKSRRSSFRADPTEGPEGDKDMEELMATLGEEHDRAELGLRALVAFGTDVIPRLAEIRIDSLALGFALIATLVTGLSIGLLPAMQASGVNVLNALKAAGPGSVGSGRYLRGGLVVVEVSLSLVLLITTGLLLTSSERLQRVDPGFEAQGVFTAQIALPPRYSRAKLIEFYEQFYQRLATLPGASSAALSD